MNREQTTTGNISGHVADNYTTTDAAISMYSFRPNNVQVKLLFCTIGIIGVLGNLIVIVVIFRFTNLAKKVTSMYIINQSLIDLVAAVLVLLAAFIDIRFMPADDGALAQIYCRVWLTQTLQWGFIRSSTVNLMCLSIERYIAVVHPIRYKTSFTRNKVFTSLVFVWLVGVTYTSIGTTPASAAVGGQCYPVAFWPSHQFHIVVTTVNTCVIMICPLTVHAFCYGRILCTLRHRSRPPKPTVFIVDTPKPDDVHTSQSVLTNFPRMPMSSEAGSSTYVNKAKESVTQMLSIVTCCYVICFVPYQLRLLVFHLVGTGECTLCWIIPVTLVFAHCCANPLIYTARYAEFQEGLRKLVLYLRKTCDTASDAVAQTTDPLPVVLNVGHSQL
ncbi:hypothetical protein LSAT2_002115 [Lamellibrachia satsuma]|nr:hypothetical protein LSAT2_002115 [Lamellibrachia satsuma]